jgi:hypothetical protein
MQDQTLPRRKRKWLLLAALAALIAAGAVCWTTVLKDRFIPKRFGVVEPGSIYRCGQLSSSLVKDVLAEHNIRVIIDLTNDDLGNADQQAEKKAAAELNIKIRRFPLAGNGTGDASRYAGAVAAIAEAKKNSLPVLVHCAAGAQRTGGVITVYRLLVQKKDPALCISEMKHFGWDPKSNPALVPFLNSHMAEFANLLKQAGVIDQVPSPLPQLPVEN